MESLKTLEVLQNPMLFFMTRREKLQNDMEFIFMKITWERKKS